MVLTMWMDARLEEGRGQQRAQRAPRGGAHRDDREEPLAGGPIVEVVAVGPELRDGGQAEDADPDEEEETQHRDPGLEAHVEELDADEEEDDDAHDQAHPVHARGEPAVERDEAHQRDGLGGRRVGLHLRALGEGEDERLARDLEDVVPDHQQEQVQRQQQHGRALARAHVAEDAQEPVDEAALLGDPARQHRRVVRHAGPAIAAAGSTAGIVSASGSHPYTRVRRSREASERSRISSSQRACTAR